MESHDSRGIDTRSSKGVKGEGIVLASQRGSRTHSERSSPKQRPENERAG